MTSRALTILALLAAGLILIAVLAQRSGAPTAQRAEPLLQGLAERLNDLERVTLSKAGNETVVTLERGESGWAVVERDSYPADTPKLRRALLALAEARLVERKTATESLYERIGVEDIGDAGAAGLALELSGGGSYPTLILGDGEGAGQRYVRRASEAQSYLIDRNPDLPRNTAQWLDPTILDVRGERVQQVTITHPDGEVLRVFKDSREQLNFSVADVPEGRELQYPGVANVIGNALRELNLEDVERVSAPPEHGTTKTELRTFDGLVVTLEGFRRDEAAWATFRASFDPEQAGRFTAASAGADDAASEQASDQRISVEQEAFAINARTGGWRYRIASYQFDQMTRRLDDLLLSPPQE